MPMMVHSQYAKCGLKWSDVMWSLLYLHTEPDSWLLQTVGLWNEWKETIVEL